MLQICKKTVVFIAFLIITAATVSAQSAVEVPHKSPVFDLPLEQKSTSGHIKLIWKSPVPTTPQRAIYIQLQKSQNPDFEKAKVIYQGDDLATFMSGLADGTYYFRLRYVKELGNTPVSAWSKPLVLNVEHHSLKLALWLFVLGFVVFLATVGVLIKGVKECKV